VPFTGGPHRGGSWPPATARSWSSAVVPSLRLHPGSALSSGTRMRPLARAPSSEPTSRSPLIPSFHGNALQLSAPSLHFYGNCKTLSPFVSSLGWFFLCLCWLCLFFVCSITSKTGLFATKTEHGPRSRRENRWAQWSCLDWVLPTGFTLHPPFCSLRCQPLCVAPLIPPAKKSPFGCVVSPRALLCLSRSPVPGALRRTR